MLVTIAAALLIAAPTPGAFTLHGTVTRVLDGDTLEVRLDSGRRDRVRLIGIDTPERSDCFGPEAIRAARALALGKHVLLRGDRTQDTRDRYGRHPSVCIPPSSAVGDLDCGDVPFRDFEVVGRDPHHLDTDGDGIGCE